MRSLVDLDISASRDKIQNGISGRWNKRIRRRNWFARSANARHSDDETVAKRGTRFCCGLGHPPFLNVVPEIVEDTDKVAIKVGGSELAELPRFVLGL
jgi:hypothetical protein